MFYLEIPETDLFNEKNGEIFTIKKQTLELEHSLKSLAKWESIWKKPFFSKEEMTIEQTLSYIKCMTITPRVNDLVYTHCIKAKDIEAIMLYIKDPMTATTFSKSSQPPSREIITAEIIYYWMIQANVPFECEKWHLERLMTLLEVCSRKNAPPKKMNKKELANRNRSLNAARRAKTGSRG